jgi:hypothetical protein
MCDQLSARRCHCQEGDPASHDQYLRAETFPKVPHRRLNNQRQTARDARSPPSRNWMQELIQSKEKVLRCLSCNDPAQMIYALA